MLYIEIKIKIELKWLQRTIFVRSIKNAMSLQKKNHKQKTFLCWNRGPPEVCCFQMLPNMTETGWGSHARDHLAQWQRVHVSRDSTAAAAPAVSSSWRHSCNFLTCRIFTKLLISQLRVRSLLFFCCWCFSSCQTYRIWIVLQQSLCLFSDKPLENTIVFTHKWSCCSKRLLYCCWGSCLILLAMEHDICFQALECSRTSRFHIPVCLVTSTVWFQTQTLHVRNAESEQEHRYTVAQQTAISAGSIQVRSLQKQVKGKTDQPVFGGQSDFWRFRLKFNPIETWFSASSTETVSPDF